jgi:hypothetical protein
VVAGSLLQAETQERLGDALLAAARHWPVELHFQRALEVFEETKSARDTAANLAVLDAFVLAMVSGGGTPANQTRLPGSRA